MILTVVAIIVTILIALWQRERKHLSYAVLSVSKLVTIESGAMGDVEVRYKGYPVKDVSLVVLKLWNAGNQVIDEDDFKRPIIFSFGFPDAEVVGLAGGLEVTPYNLPAVVGFDSTRVQVNPMLLNPGYSVQFGVLLTGFKGEIKPDMLIRGVSTLRRVEATSWYPRADIRGAVSVTVTAAVAFVVAPLAVAVIERLMFHQGVRDVVDTVIVAQTGIGYGLLLWFWYLVPKRNASTFRPWNMASWTLPWVGAIVVLFALLEVALLPYLNSLLVK